MPSPGVIALVALGLLFLVLALFSWFQPRAPLAIARWAQVVRGLDESPDLFFTRVYQMLKGRLSERHFPFSSIGFGPRHLFATRTALGGRPLYLTVRYQHLTFYIYASPTPGGLFVSSWLFSRYTSWQEHPLLRVLLGWRLYHQTLFQVDVMEMFHQAVHSVVMEVLDNYCEERGLVPLEVYERRPVLHSYYATMKYGAPGTGAQAYAGSAPGYATPLVPGAETSHAKPAALRLDDVLAPDDPQAPTRA